VITFFLSKTASSYLNGNGNFAIGHTSPSTKFHVKGKTYIDGLRADSAGDTLQIRDSGGTVNVVFEDGGNVGIGTAVPNSMFQVDGSVSFGTISTSTNYNTSDEVFIGVNNTNSSRIVTIQTSDIVKGRVFIIKDESGGAGTNSIRIQTQGSETMDGVSTIQITSNYGVARLYVGVDGNLYTW